MEGKVSKSKKKTVNDFSFLIIIAPTCKLGPTDIIENFRDFLYHKLTNKYLNKNLHNWFTYPRIKFKTKYNLTLTFKCGRSTILDSLKELSQRKVDYHITNDSIIPVPHPRS